MESGSSRRPLPGTRNPLGTPPAVYTISGLLTALICGPLFGDYLLYRDAVATPRFPLTAAAFGIDGSAPRAVPQDGALAVGSSLIDGGWLVAGLTALAIFAAGVGFGRLALRSVPRAGTAGAVAAATVGVWNPWVAERLLQGHWSLLAGYAALGWAVCAVQDLAHDRSWRRWAVLAGILAAAGLTPTGSVLVLVVAAVTAVAAGVGGRDLGLSGLLWLATASPWLVASAVASGVSSSGGAAAFALRAEPWLGSLGTALGLGGTWNADAVPASRTTPWALVATLALLAVVVVGTRQLMRSRARTDRTVVVLGGLAATAVVLVVLAATPPGLAVMDLLLAHVPGAGLLRDTQKYLALAVPFAAIAAAAAVEALRTLVPAGFAAAAVVALIAAPLPDLAWGVGGSIRPIAYPDDYARVTSLIGDDASGRTGAVALWPAENVRRLSFADGPSLTPLPRMLDAPVIVSGELTVDGETVDAPAGRTADVVAALRDGGDPRLLARLGVGWVVVEESDPPARLAATAPVFAGEHLRVYRIVDATPPPTPTVTEWAAAIVAFALWISALLAGLGTAVAARVRPSPR
ncbi:hypothetical protein [Gordonia neofelifaecis]|uniref:Transmembrane protein n=1 Tax=Gordonia neofelifaecis NRRL B-59395 TaxID=644548 RepID=F1YPW1_9ACTN|nr:hypothetical protein [Gordonia neofelifaecis]EGD53250.1 hypothetical protein SCNU_19862 [Gordonia neofelifaecis NRRL B-59395]